MRIISKFRDYYDGVSWFDSDDKLYLRHTRQEKGAEFEGVINACANVASWDCGWRRKTNLTRVVVFCGKAYPYIEAGGNIYHSWQDFREALPSLAQDCTYLADDLRFLEQEEKGGFRRWGGYTHVKEAWDSFCAELAKVDWTPFHLRYQAPILLQQDWDNTPGMAWKAWRNGGKEQHKGHLVVNPCLRDSEFFKVVPPDQAYQEIDMFLGNVLTYREKLDRVRTSEEVRDSHGFDSESFVGTPGLSKKERRKLNKKRKRRS